MAVEFLLITNQKFKDEKLPEYVLYKEKDGASVFDVKMDYTLAVNFLQLYLDSEIDDVRELLTTFINKRERDSEDITRVLDLINNLKINDFIIEFTADFADWPDDNEYSMTCIDGKVKKDCIISGDIRCVDNELDLGYKLLGINPGAGYK